MDTHVDNDESKCKSDANDGYQFKCEPNTPEFVDDKTSLDKLMELAEVSNKIYC